MHRSVLVIDVEKFGDPTRTNAHQVAVRDGMYQALEGALADAGISRPNRTIEDRGDGALVLISPEVPKSWLVTRLPIQLAAALDDHNATCSANARIRLRMVLHAGEIHPDAHGVTGSAVNRTFRLVEAPVLKSARVGPAGVLMRVARRGVRWNVDRCGLKSTWGQLWRISGEIPQPSWRPLPLCRAKTRSWALAWLFARVRLLCGIR